MLLFEQSTAIALPRLWLLAHLKHKSALNLMRESDANTYHSHNLIETHQAADDVLAWNSNPTPPSRRIMAVSHMCQGRKNCRQNLCQTMLIMSSGNTP